jgi:hypothetical protein
MASVVGDVPNLPNSTTTTNPTSAKIFYHVPIYYTTIAKDPDHCAARNEFRKQGNDKDSQSLRKRSSSFN